MNRLTKPGSYPWKLRYTKPTVVTANGASASRLWEKLLYEVMLNLQSTPLQLLQPREHTSSEGTSLTL